MEIEGPTIGLPVTFWDRLEGGGRSSCATQDMEIEGVLVAIPGSFEEILSYL